jgi:hypothetical protein
LTGFVFHLPALALRRLDSLKPYYVKLTDGLAARGHPVRLVPHDRATLLAEVAVDDAVHIVDHGSLRHPRVFNTGIAYIYPFWNLDPWGIRALSSIAEKPFDPAGIDAAFATSFAHRLRKRWVVGRRSRYPQPTARTVVQAGCIAVFLQSDADRLGNETCYLTLRQMVKAVVARPDPRPIVIKPHPLDTDPKTRRFLAKLADGDPRVQITDGNIHDILARADVCVTINSAVGIEAMLHQKPVVLCGRADFHHAAVTVANARGLDAAIALAEATDWPHDAYLYWYFGLNCLNAGTKDLVGRFLDRTLSP